MILLDTSGLLTAIDEGAVDHAAALACLELAKRPLLLSPFVLAELDYFLADRVGVEAELKLLREVAEGRYSLKTFEVDDIELAQRIVHRYADLNIGLADASIVVLANRYGTCDVLTLDERHFRALRTESGRPFRILPADAV